MTFRGKRLPASGVAAVRVESDERDAAVLERERADALAGEREYRVGDRGRNQRHAGLAQAAGRSLRSRNSATSIGGTSGMRGMREVSKFACSTRPCLIVTLLRNALISPVTVPPSICATTWSGWTAIPQSTA